MKLARLSASELPRVLNIYTYAPLFNGYFESLGVQPENIVLFGLHTQSYIVPVRVAERSIPVSRQDRHLACL